MTVPAQILKFLSALLIVAILTMRLGSLSEEVFVTPVEDSLFGAAFMAAEPAGNGKAPALLKGQACLDWELPPVLLVRICLQSGTETPVCVPGVSPRLLADEIYVPPENGCRGMSGLDPLA